MLTKINKVFYFIPLMPRKRVKIDSKFLNKLRIESTDNPRTRHIKSNLNSFFIEYHNKHTYKYPLIVIPGLLSRFTIYFIVGIYITHPFCILIGFFFFNYYTVNFKLLQYKEIYDFLL